MPCPQKFNFFTMNRLLNFVETKDAYGIITLFKTSNSLYGSAPSLDPSWTQILRLNNQVLVPKDPVSAFQVQNSLTQTFHSLLPSLSKWAIPFLLFLNKRLFRLAVSADNYLAKQSNKPVCLAEAVRTMNKALSTCLSDRSSIDISKKWAAIAIINILFASYFHTNSTNLCQNLIRAIYAAELPDLNLFPMSNRVVFAYWTGRLAFVDSEFQKSWDELGFCLRNISKHSNKKSLVLVYLIPLGIYC